MYIRQTSFSFMDDRVSGTDVEEEEEDEESGKGGGTYLMCVGELVRETSARKKGKEVTVGFLVSCIINNVLCRESFIFEGLVCTHFNVW